MRLTLRTLLAWLDTVLLPDDQKSLGDKVAASPVAPQLIARIREVVERPVLAAPRPEGRGLADDPNSVAEYLDNTLPADQLEAFERVCIESDLHLAEVAACHGILAEIAREPLAVDPLDVASRRRLMTAIRHHMLPEPNPAPPSGGQRGAAVAAVDGAACDTVLGRPLEVARSATTQPKAPLAAWLSAAVALLLLVTLGGFLWWSLARETRRKVAVRPSPPAAATVQPGPPRAEEPQRGDEPAEPAADPAPAARVAATPPADEPQVPADTPAAAVPAVEPVVEPAAPAVAAAPAPRVPQGDALAIAAPQAMPQPPAESPSPAASPPASNPEDPGVGFVSGGALLLHKAAAEPAAAGVSGWAALPPNAPLGLREDLIAPPFCRPEVSVGGVTIRLEPNTRAAITRDTDGSPRLEIVFGRAVIRSSVAKPRLGITAGGLVGVITDGLRGPVGVEVDLVPRVSAQLATTTSGIGWLQSLPDGTPAPQPLHGVPAQGLLEKESRLAWHSDDPAAVVPQTRMKLPDWLPGPPHQERIEEDAARVLAAKATPDPLEKGLRELADDDRRFENRSAAVATLALLGDYDELVAVLSAETGAKKQLQLQDGQWTRLFDMTIPLALARGANAAARLKLAFETRGPAGRGGEAFALASGFDDAALADGGDARLVDALDAPELLLRRLAIHALLEIVQPADADRNRYRPERSKELRREGLNWWRKQLADGRIRRPAGTEPR